MRTQEPCFCPLHLLKSWRKRQFGFVVVEHDRCIGVEIIVKVLFNVPLHSASFPTLSLPSSPYLSGGGAILCPSSSPYLWGPHLGWVSVSDWNSLCLSYVLGVKCCSGCFVGCQVLQVLCWVSNVVQGAFLGVKCCSGCFVGYQMLFRVLCVQCLLIIL